MLGYKWLAGDFWYDSNPFSVEFSENRINRQAVNLTWIEDGVNKAPRGRKVKLAFNKLDTYQMVSVSEVREYDAEH